MELLNTIKNISCIIVFTYNKNVISSILSSNQNIIRYIYYTYIIQKC